MLCALWIINQFGRGEAPTKREEFQREERSDDQRSDDLFESVARNGRSEATTSSRSKRGFERSEKPDEFGIRLMYKRIWVLHHP